MQNKISGTKIEGIEIKENGQLHKYDNCEMDLIARAFREEVF